MRCTNCDTDNPSTNNFCAKCGNALAQHCAKCKAENPPTSDFCGKCGASLSELVALQPVASPELISAAPGPAPAGERRHLTILFCDLVGSTEMQHQLDPEESREIVAGYQRAVAASVERFGGQVAKFLGDGVMAYFGYPQAHDNDVERAVRAGLEILDSIKALNARGDRPKLSARIGIHTGSVVVGAGGGTDADIFGDAPNLASRVQSAAEPDTLVISADTHRLVAGMFVVENRGAHDLKGIAQPVGLYRVIQPSGVRTRFHSSGRALTPFIGRDEELRLLWNRWERLLDGEGQVVLIAGEAGIGKSRLVEQFHERLAGTPHTWVECASAPYFQNTPFYSVTDMLQQGFALRGDESAEEKLNQLERNLELSGLKPAEAAPLIAPLLNLAVPEKYPPLLLSPEQRRKRLLAALAAWTFGAARAQPMVIVLEDLHWVDPSTMELLQILVDQGATAALLLLYTARPEFRAPWPMRAHHAQVTLSRLHSRQVREMIAGFAASGVLGSEVIDAVVSRTSGVPLFVEELTRAVLDSGGRDASRKIPATLEDSLMARLDTLGPAKEVAQVASVIGREFSYELLRAISPMKEDELQSALEKLADAELIYVRGITPEATYQFKHALIQDAAYEALLKSRRKELHRHVARTISEIFPAIAEARPEVLARHWTGAGEAEPAIEAWKKAGEAADARGALKEAEEDFRQALAMLGTLPESPERDTRELTLVTALGWLLLRTKGYAAAETIEVNERARALADKTGNLSQLVLQVIGTYAAVNVSGDYSGAAALADQLLDLAQREGSRMSLATARVAQVNVRFNRGDFVGLEEHFAVLRGLAEADDLRQFAGAFANGIVISWGYACLGAWVRGHAEEARGRIAEAIAFARDRKDPFLLAGARSFECYLYRWLRDPPRAADAAAESVSISEEHGFAFTRDSSRIILGWARAQLANPAEGVALIRQSLAGRAETGVRTDITNVLTILAEAQALDGAIDDALITLDNALEANPEELWCRPNNLKWRGELRLKIGQPELAEADFREAIALAQKMSGKAWELRAATSLARLLAMTGKRDETRAMLADIYNWFTEGLDTPDLKDAKALLDELAG